MASVGAVVMTVPSPRTVVTGTVPSAVSGRTKPPSTTTCTTTSPAPVGRPGGPAPGTGAPLPHAAPEAAKSAIPTTRWCEGLIPIRRFSTRPRFRIGGGSGGAVRPLPAPLHPLTDDVHHVAV